MTTAISEDRFRNQKELINAEKLASTRFVVVGAGAIGSFLVSCLSKMGARDITVYDFDSLEDHNFANQMYPISTLGKPKVDALQDVAKDYGDCVIKTKNSPWTSDNAVDGDVIISCVDNMDVRAAMYHWYKQKAGTQLFIDGRMSARIGQVYGIELLSSESAKRSQERYEASLFPQRQASPERCGQKSIIYTVMALASLMLNQVDLWLNGEYRSSYVNLDLFNGSLVMEYDQEREIQTFEAEDEVEEVKTTPFLGY